MVYQHSRLQKWIINLLVIAGCAFTIASAYPGFMSFDSLDQYVQAKNNVYNDWHPPFMAWLWNKFLYIIDGPNLMMFLFNLTYWFSIWLIATKIKNFALCIFLIALSLSPVMINFIGVIWKDTFLFSLLILVCAILFTIKGIKISRLRKFLLFSLLVVIHFIAILLRHNAITAVLPLLILSIITTFGNRRLIAPILAGLFISVALFIAGQKVNDTLCKGRHLHPEQQLMIFDLMGISQDINKNLMPDYLQSKLTLDSIKQYYFYSSGGLYPIFSMHCNTSDPDKLHLLKQAWVSAIKNHPKELVKHKYLVFLYLQSESSLVTYNSINENKYGIVLKPNRVRETFISYTEGSFAKTLYKAKYYTWGCLIILATSLLLIRKNEQIIYPLLISLSGVFYSLTYFLLSPTSDLRYNYWTIGAAIISFVFLINFHLDKKKLLR